MIESVVDMRLSYDNFHHNRLHLLASILEGWTNTMHISKCFSLYGQQSFQHELTCEVTY